MKPLSLPDLPYDILHLIFTQLDNLRIQTSKPPRGRPPIPTHPTHYVYFHPPIQTLPPQKPHDSPRRAEKYRIEQANLIRSSDGDYWRACLDDVAPAPYDCVSVFDGLSRTSKALRDLCAPYIFRNVVLASDDCLTLDRVQFYASEEAGWMLKHVRSLRLLSTHTTWPNCLGGNTPKHLLPGIAATLVRLLLSIPNLQTLHFVIEPGDLISEFKSLLTSTTPRITFPTVRNICINTLNEYIIPSFNDLESFEYKSAYSTRSFYKVSFSTLGATTEEKETGLFGGMTDTRAVDVIRGLAGLTEKTRLRKIILAAFVNDTGIIQMAKAGILENVRELILYYAVASSCVSALSHLPNLTYIRFGQDDEPISAKNPHCYMSRRELLLVACAAKKLKEVWFRDRFVCYVKRLVGEGHDGTEVDEERTYWMDTWAPDGVGNKTVISSGWLS